jgi:hypothetical protein
MIQSSQPFIVTVVPEPSRSTNIGDVIIASLGLAGALTLAALVLGAVVALGLIVWRRSHPPEAQRLPSVTSATPLHPPSSPTR